MGIRAERFFKCWLRRRSSIKRQDQARIARRRTDKVVLMRLRADGTTLKGSFFQDHSGSDRQQHIEIQWGKLKLKKLEIALQQQHRGAFANGNAEPSDPGTIMSDSFLLRLNVCAARKIDLIVEISFPTEPSRVGGHRQYHHLKRTPII